MKNKNKAKQQEPLKRQMWDPLPRRNKHPLLTGRIRRVLFFTTGQAMIGVNVFDI